MFHRVTNTRKAKLTHNTEVGLFGDDSGFVGTDTGVKTGIRFSHVGDQQIARVEDLYSTGQFDTLRF